MKRILLFGAIASVFMTGAFATSSTVTSRDYVDAQDALKQDVIPGAGVNLDENGIGETVVTYTNEAGALGERGIFDINNDYDYQNHQIESGHEDDILPANAYADLESWVSNIENNVSQIPTVPDLSNLTLTTVSDETCISWVPNAAQTDENCLLWEVSKKDVYACVINGGTCTTNGECCSGNCNNGLCATACKPYGTTVSSRTECCSGELQVSLNSTKCGCRGDADCSFGAVCGTNRICAVSTGGRT